MIAQQFRRQLIMTSPHASELRYYVAARSGSQLWADLDFFTDDLRHPSMTYVAHESTTALRAGIFLWIGKIFTAIKKGNSAAVNWDAFLDDIIINNATGSIYYCSQALTEAVVPLRRYHMKIIFAQPLLQFSFLDTRETVNFENLTFRGRDEIHSSWHSYLLFSSAAIRTHSRSYPGQTAARWQCTASESPVGIRICEYLDYDQLHWSL